MEHVPHIWKPKETAVTNVPKTTERVPRTSFSSTLAASYLSSPEVTGEKGRHQRQKGTGRTEDH